ncbi:MAG: hypothetical protein KDE14_02805 [Rhodobacteraceae bacterium]|nr:hypothetical protein [Paracoccaceae bacterium]
MHISIERPEEIIPRLGKHELHWKKGRSAYELSTAWVKANGFPPAVETVLKKAPDWENAKFLEGFFERETELGTAGRPSQTDLLVLASLPECNGVIGVEGKVDEPFGPPISDWLKDDQHGGRRKRLSALCATLGIKDDSIGHLYYQLFHRTCAAIYEAHRFRYQKAIMLVHSFDPQSKWFDAFADFAQHAGMEVAAPNEISRAKFCAGIETRLAWVSDKPI